MIFASTLKNIVTAMFPYCCVVCNRPSDINLDLCSICYNDLPYLKDACFVCGALLQYTNESIRCESCQQSPPHYDRLFTAFSYAYPFDQFINEIKFGRNLHKASLVADLFLKQLPLWYKDYSQLPDAIIPVPLSRWRYCWRGFNQSCAIYKNIAKHLNIDFAYKMCQRTRYTKPQARLNKQQRARNLIEAFKLTEKPNYQHVVIADDVVTTGSTVNAIAYLLKQAGVELVEVWAICRA